MIELSSPNLHAIIDEDNGADVLSLSAGGAEILFSTPWTMRARRLREGRSAPISTDSMGRWLEAYCGGWQTLLPNAGPERRLGGAVWGYHGEMSLVAWPVIECTPSSVVLTTELFTVPFRIERTIVLQGSTITISDKVQNLGAVDVAFDYVQHPAFSGCVIDDGCVIETSARHFHSDPDTLSSLRPDTRSDWPLALAAEGGTIDLSRIPSAPGERNVFGWLSDFDRHEATIRNPQTGVVITIEWDGRRMPYAWLWQELNTTEGWPWFKRARVLAIEPSSTITGGTNRTETAVLGAYEEMTFDIAVHVMRGANR